MNPDTPDDLLDSEPGRTSRIEEKFRALEKNIGILMSNSSLVSSSLRPSPQAIQPFRRNDSLDRKAIETLIFLLKGIKQECELIRQAQQEKNIGFLINYQEKLALLSEEVYRLESEKPRKAPAKPVIQTFPIFHAEGRPLPMQVKNATAPLAQNKENLPRKQKAPDVAKSGLKTKKPSVVGNNTNKFSC